MNELGAKKQDKGKNIEQNVDNGMTIISIKFNYFLLLFPLLIFCLNLIFRPLIC
jgi:hypothetical protein